MADLTPEALAPLLYLAYVTGMHEAALQSPAARAAALASVNGFSVIAREYRAGWTAAATEAHARLAPAPAALAAERDAALKTVARWQGENQRLIEERDELRTAVDAALKIHRQHVSGTRPGQSFSPTFPSPGICVHDHQAWPCPTVQAIAREALEGGHA